MKILLNQFDNPRLSDQVFVGKGDSVYAGRGAEEYGFTHGKKYVIQDVSPFGFLTMENDSGEVEEYTVEYFQNTKPVVLG